MEVLHLHTYFIFPFCIDQDAVMEDHPEIWNERDLWFEKLDFWVTKHGVPECPELAARLDRWKRSPETRFDLDSQAYQDMVFFHPFVRGAFFDTGGGSDHDHDALVHSYSIPIPPESRLFYAAEDICGESASTEVTDLRLLLFANGIGILTIGVEARDVSYTQALWINEMMRKIYPSSDRQILSGRIPNRLSLTLEEGGQVTILAQEQFQNCGMNGLRPRLSKILLSLLSFANYADQEFEPVLDERMVVNSFISLNRDRLPHGFETSEDYEIAFSRLLYVDRNGPGYRYEERFVRDQMNKQVYRRWQHLGTLYGVTSYSNVTSIIASPVQPDQNALVYRMFKTKNRLIAIIALFYRASLLNFARESALVSRELFPVFSGKVVRHRHIQVATRLMADFNYFSNYWFFSELTTKDEELEHFRLLCDAYQIDRMKEDISEEIDKLAGYIDRLYSLRNGDAVNRLAMQGVILGIGALVTGFYGMNIPPLGTFLQSSLVSMSSLILTTVLTLASLSFIVYIVFSNWVDYRASLMPHKYRKPFTRNSLRRMRTTEGNHLTRSAKKRT